MKFILFCALTACFITTPSFASPNQPKSSLTGVWTGRIGNLPVTVCFNDLTRDIGYGNYYYQRHLVPINLYGYQDDAGKITTWKESDGQLHANDLDNYDGAWQIGPLPPNRIHGTWSNRSGSKKLPIELTKVEYATEASKPKEEMESGSSASTTKPCSSNLYNKAIEQTVATFVGPVHTTNNIKYRLVTRGFPGRKKPAEFGDRGQFIAAVELIGNTSAYKNINAALRERLSPEREAQLLECRRNQIDSDGGGASEGDYTENMSVFVASHWLTINVENRHDCGERNEIFDDTYMWNLDTGNRVSLFSLFKGIDVSAATGTSAEYSSEGILPEALDEFIATHFQKINNPYYGWDEIQECYGPYKPGEYTYRLKLVEKGIIFEIPRHLSGTCGASVSVTFEELQPFLNMDGRKFAATLTVRKTKRQ